MQRAVHSQMLNSVLHERSPQIPRIITTILCHGQVSGGGGDVQTSDACVGIEVTLGSCLAVRQRDVVDRIGGERELCAVNSLGKPVVVAEWPIY